ncbi:MAG: hypothetical protein KC586_30185, partial [Myxococcales bacterium]|nr:hypothetical protein [Myxococcales bacterium]
RLGIDALVSVRCVDATYHGPTRDALASPEIEPLVAALVAEELRQPRHEALLERLRARLDEG